MGHPIQHAKNSARRYGGNPEEYIHIHNWFDESKAQIADFRHRALRHHAEGIMLAEQVFGQSFINSGGRKVFVRYVGADHVREDLGRVPSFQDWVAKLPIEPWMYGQKLTVTEEL